MTTREQPDDARVLTLGKDGDRLAHYADKADIILGHVEGVPIRALCGIWWTPTRSPDGLPVCTRCVTVLEQIKNRDRGRRGFN